AIAARPRSRTRCVPARGHGFAPAGRRAQPGAVLPRTRCGRTPAPAARQFRGAGDRPVRVRAGVVGALAGGPAPGATAWTGAPAGRGRRRAWRDPGVRPLHHPGDLRTLVVRTRAAG